MYGLLSMLLILACPLGMAAMMAIPALWHRFARTSKPDAGAAPAERLRTDADERVLAHQHGG